MSTKILEVETVRAGQPWPYADSVWEAYISCRVEGLLKDGAALYLELDEAKIRTITKLFVREFPDEPPHVFAPRLTVCEPVGPTEKMKEIAHKKWEPEGKSRWHVIVVQLFAD